ncbi:MAG TPA: sigma-70 family RNA polymerase sigma factor [Lacunisphaera sp.]|nr:sigma-70 family RNA polymerase sigma factor [Lacunisphaera sp.]
MFQKTSEEPSDRTPENDEEDDASLVRRFNAGDEAAFATIVKNHYARVLALARRSMNNNQDAEDIAQITFIRAHRGLASFRGDSALSTWLARIALNLARNRYWYFFRRRRQDTISLDHPHSIADIVSTEEATPAQHAIHSEFAELAAKCLDQLDAPQRDILRMRYQQQYSYGEIADELKINFGTVKSRVARAREKLRALILASAPDFGNKASMGNFFEPVRYPPAAATPVA